MRLPILVLRRLFTKLGPYRSSNGAKEELGLILEKSAHSVTSKAKLFATHAKRKTIKKKDVEMALQHF